MARSNQGETGMTDEQEFEFAPWRVDHNVRSIGLTGYLIGWQDNAPFFMRTPGTSDHFIIAFSTVERLRSFHGRTGYTIKQIDDGREFLDSLPMRMPDGSRLRVALDPWETANGTTRFTEVLRDHH